MNCTSDEFASLFDSIVFLSIFLKTEKRQTSAASNKERKHLVLSYALVITFFPKSLLLLTCSFTIFSFFFLAKQFFSQVEALYRNNLSTPTVK